MLINEHTKIAALLKHHPDALETIVPLSPDFRKLRNPVLRKLMAGRTTIRMAAKIGGCRPEDFYKVLAPLGFEAEGSPAATQDQAEPKHNPKPEYLRGIASERLIHFDVRAMLASGTDPLKAIQQKVHALKRDEVLVIVNNFEPVPLINLLEKQGFRSHVQVVDQDRIETYFYRLTADREPKKEEDTEVETAVDPGDWESLLKRYGNRLVELDVRHLEMPQPMMTILEHLQSLPEEKALYVHHKRIPVFLLTELKDRGFDYRIKEVQDGPVYLLIFKNNSER